MAQANNAKKEKFIDLLHELFQLNQPELDFGLYRIMHAKSAQIKGFIENDLASEIDQAFAANSNNAVAELKAAYEQARANAVEFGIAEPDTNPKVQTTKAAYDAARDNGNDPADIYDHLYRFFSRYYDKGDFLSRRYHVAENDSRAAPYAVPYDGREVYLHWANKDQYYIKSSETLTHFSFDLSEAITKEQQRAGKDKNAELALETPTGQTLKVKFQLVEASEGAHNNVKENQSRFFIIDDTNPIALAPSPLAGEGRGEGDKSTTLTINFQYRFDPEKSGQDATWQKKRMDEAEATILSALKQANAKPFIDGLSYPAPTDKQKERTLLGKYLMRYTARNTMDYFIHKDLGGFLKRELDFYIKNEIMRLDDIENADAPQVEQWLGKVRALRTIARQIIQFLTQVEEFQKKLWLKKKFVTETNYCITLDRVPEALYPAIAANEAQQQEWVRLFAINEIEATAGDLASIGKPGYSEPLTVEFLKANPYLMLDTSLFDEVFKAQLLASVEGLDERCDGVLIHSDNFQALNLMQAQHQEKVKCVYIDPPYNTSSSAIPYKNDYQHSSWGTLMRDRVQLLKGLMSKDSAIFVSIDKAERTLLEHAMDSIFGRENRVEELIWSMNTNNSQAPNYSTNHEYVLVYAKNRATVEGDRSMFREPKPGYEEVMALVARLNPEYPTIEKIEAELKKLYQEHIIHYRDEIESQGLDWEVEKRNDPWKGLFNYNHAEYRDESGRLIDEKYARSSKARLWVWREADSSMPATKQADSTRDRNHKNWRFYKPSHPVTNKPAPHPKSGWKFAYDDDEDSPEKRSFVSLDRDGRISWGDDENKVPQIKRMLHEVETNVGKSVFTDYSDGEKQTSAMFGESGIFLAPKHADFVSRFVLHAAKKDSTVVDCFGGSGSTAHAVIKLNREDRGQRKFALIEMGNHFDTVLKPRILKAIYASEWRLGKPISHDGISQCIKYLRLESYEDTLNNLVLDGDEQRAQALSEHGGLRRDYLLNYFLDVETRGSASLLNVQQFRDPTAYTLKVKKPGAETHTLKQVDLIETFNWLIGLEVALLDKPRIYEARFEREHDPELPGDQHTRLKVTRFKELDSRLRGNDGGGRGSDENEGHWFRTVEGYVRRTPGSDANRAKVLVIWRKLTDDPEQDAAALEALLEKYRINQADNEFDLIYINGPHGLVLSGQAKARVLSLEEAFMAKMWEGAE